MTERLNRAAVGQFLRRFLGLGLVGIALVAAIYFLWRDGRILLDYSFELRPGVVLLSFVIECLGLLIAIPVWHQIISRFDVRSSYWADLRIYSYSMLGVVLPGGIWSAVSRATLYERINISGLKVGAASVVEFVLLGIAGLLVYGITSLIQPTEGLWQRPVIAWIVIAVALVLLQPPLFNRLATWLLRLRDAAARPVMMSYADLFLWIAVHTLVIAIGGAATFVLLWSFVPTSVDLLVPVITAWAVAAITGNLLFWLPGTPVIRDGVMAAILAGSLTAPVAIIFVLLIRVWTLASILLLMAIIWLLDRLINRFSPD